MDQWDAGLNIRCLCCVSRARERTTTRPWVAWIVVLEELSSSTHVAGREGTPRWEAELGHAVRPETARLRRRKNLGYVGEIVQMERLPRGVSWPPLLIDRLGVVWKTSRRLSTWPHMTGAGQRRMRWPEYSDATRGASHVSNILGTRRETADPPCVLFAQPPASSP